MAARPQCRILGRPSKPGARLPSWLLGTVRCNFRTCMEPGLSSCGMKVPAGIRSGKRFTKSDTEALKRLLGVCRGADRLGARVFFHDVFWKLAVEQLLAEAPEVPHDCPCPCLYHAVHERLHHDSICLVPQYYRDDVVNHGKVVLPALPEQRELGLVEVSKVHRVLLVKVLVEQRCHDAPHVGAPEIVNQINGILRLVRSLVRPADNECRGREPVVLVHYLCALPYYPSPLVSGERLGLDAEVLLYHPWRHSLYSEVCCKPFFI